MALTYAQALTNLTTHAGAAGAAVVPPILDVAAGPPYPASPRCVRLSYGGEADPVRMGALRDLNGELVAERILLTVWLAVSELSLGAIAAVETELFTFKHELRTRVLADSQLGGTAADLEMGYCEADYGAVGNTRYRVLEAEFTLDYTEYPIAP